MCGITPFKPLLIYMEEYKIRSWFIVFVESSLVYLGWDFQSPMASWEECFIAHIHRWREWGTESLRKNVCMCTVILPNFLLNIGHPGASHSDVQSTQNSIWSLWILQILSTSENQVTDMSEWAPKTNAPKIRGHIWKVTLPWVVSNGTGNRS